MARELTRTERIQHRSTDFKDLKLEYMFVGGILGSVVAFSKIMEDFKPDALTSDRLKHIYKVASYIYHESGERLTIRSLRNSLNVDKSKEDFFVKLYKKCRLRAKSTTVADVITAKKKLMQLYTGRHYEIGLKGLLADLSQGLNGNLDKLDNAARKVEDMYISTVQRKVATVIVDPVEEYESWKKRFIHVQKHPETIRSIPTGIEPIDRCMIGIRPSELALLIAPTSIGKSIGLMNIGTYCWLTTGDTAIFTIEMPAEQYLNRWYCSMAGINYEKFRQYALDESEWELLDKTIKKAKKSENKLHIIDMPEGCTAEAMRAEAEIIMRKRDLKLIGVDYLNIMGNKTGAFGLNWEFQVQTAVELKLNLARKLKIGVWSVAQSSEHGDMAFARHIKDQIDIGVSFTPTEDYKETKMLSLDWLKTRDFEGYSTKIYTDRGRMKLWQKSRTKAKNVRKLTKKRKRIKT